MNRKKIYPLYLALIPAVVFFIFFIVPSTVGYYYAFTNWSAARTTNLKFVGFDNIMSVLSSTKVPVADLCRRKNCYRNTSGLCFCLYSQP